MCFVFLYSLKSLYGFWELTDLFSLWNYTGSFAALLIFFLLCAVMFEGLNVVWDFVLNNIK